MHSYVSVRVLLKHTKSVIWASCWQKPNKINSCILLTFSPTTVRICIGYMNPGDNSWFHFLPFLSLQKIAITHVEFEKREFGARARSVRFCFFPPALKLIRLWWLGGRVQRNQVVTECTKLHIRWERKNIVYMRIRPRDVCFWWIYEVVPRLVVFVCCRRPTKANVWIWTWTLNRFMKKKITSTRPSDHGSR